MNNPLAYLTPDIVNARNLTKTVEGGYFLTASKTKQTQMLRAARKTDKLVKAPAIWTDALAAARAVAVDGVKVEGIGLETYIVAARILDAAGVRWTGGQRYTIALDGTPSRWNAWIEPLKG